MGVIRPRNLLLFAIVLGSASAVDIPTGECSRVFDPCSSSVYVELNDPTRSTQYNATFESSSTDFNLAQGWYRSSSAAGENMPTTPVTFGQCYAYAPIWLNGSLPSEGDGIVDIPACASNYPNPCERQYIIPVKNCGIFNVYCLYPVIDVYDRFCMGSELACPDGYVSQNGFTPGCERRDSQIPTGECSREEDPCSSTVYIELDDYTRSIQYNATLETSDSDFYLSQGWYRSVSVAGENMPMTPVTFGQCNSYSPIWIDGNLPREGDDIVDLHACASSYSENCVREYYIPVKNCGEFNVYCLYPVTDVNDRFCMGSELPCPDGYASENGFTPGCVPTGDGTSTSTASSTTTIQEGDGTSTSTASSTTTIQEDTIVAAGECPRDVDLCSRDVYIGLDEPSRSIRFNLADFSDNSHDYELPQAWYRSNSEAGGDMPTAPVRTGQCNAIAPIWLTRNLPSLHEGIVDIIACASYLNDHCVRRYSIPVKNCGTFNVYCLYPVIDSYDRFCMGDELQCSEGYDSPTGFSPGCEIVTSSEEQSTTEQTTTQTNKGKEVDGKSGDGPGSDVVIVIAVVLPLVLLIFGGMIGALIYMRMSGKKSNNDDPYDKPTKEGVPESTYDKIRPTSEKSIYDDTYESPVSVYDEIPSKMEKKDLDAPVVEPTSFGNNMYV